MADLNEELVKEAIKKAEEEAEKTIEEAAESVNDEAEEAAEKVEGTVEDIVKEAGEMAEEGENDTEDDSDESNDSEDENSETEDSSEENPEGEKKKFSFFKKDKKKEEEKKDPRDEKINELNDKLMRNLAEFENFRKRTEKEKSQMFDMGAKSVLEKMLPALDSFDLGLASLSEEDRNGAVGQGMEKIYKQLLSNLENVGVKQIESVGKEFDPNLHNAVMHEDNEEFGENTVSQELQKGYMYKDTVLRYAMVKVAN